ncbi:MAG: hypothetical protein WC565_03590 [Parcubacteria group bacterium]|jgi:hypothetical protein
MAKLTEAAPELSKYVDETKALDMAKKSVGADKPAAAKTLADLDEKERETFLTWLKWFRSEKKPGDVPALAHEPPIRVSRITGMSLDYIEQLVAERDRIVREAERGADAFKPDPKPEPPAEPPAEPQDPKEPGDGGEIVEPK